MKLSPAAEKAVAERAMATGRSREDTIDELVLLGDRYDRRIGDLDALARRRADLRDALASLYRSSDAVRLAREASVPVDGALSADSVEAWDAVVLSASRGGRLDALLWIVRLEFPRFPAVLDRIRQEREASRAAEPREADLLAKLQPIILDGGERAEAALRLIFALMWSDPRDFDGFVLDHYPAVFRKLTNTMGLDYKVGLLLKVETVQGAWTKLARAHSLTFRDVLNQHADVIAQRVGLLEADGVGKDKR